MHRLILCTPRLSLRGGLLDGTERAQFISLDADLGHKRARRETTAHRGHVEMELKE